jgi:hypothetical protein
MRTSPKVLTILLGAAWFVAHPLAAAWGQVPPDLTISMSATPNPVPRNYGYEVQLVIQNTLAPRPRPDILSPGPGLPAPSPAPVSPLDGTDVQQAELQLGSTYSASPQSMRSTPPVPINCQPSGVGVSFVSCTIGPLPRGGRWVIDMVYPWPNVPAELTEAAANSFGLSAAIDPGNQIAERDENNNVAGVQMFFEARRVP